MARARLLRRFRGGGVAHLGDPSPWALTNGGVKATLDVDFVNNRAWNAGSVVTIASLLACAANSSNRYYQNADGTLTSFAANTLRYGTNGLLVEELRINIPQRSQEVDNAYWSKNNVTVSADAVAAPDGTATADAVIVGSGSKSSPWISRSLSLTVAAYTHSVYLKNGTLGNNWVFIRNDGATAINQWANLSTGALGTSGAGVTSASLIALANGWYRLVMTFASAQAPNDLIVSTAPADNSTGNVTGNGTSPSFYIWGIQSELGSFATSYIPTTSASATRAADIITFSDLTWLDGSNDTLYAEWIARNVNNAKVWALDATNDKLIDEQTGMSARIAGATVATTAAAGATVKAAARLTLDNFGISMNGGAAATDTSETAPGTLSASRLGVDLSGNNSLNGYIRRVAAFKGLAALDAALVTLST